MFEYLKLTMWEDGTEHCVAYENFALDERGIWYGTAYHLENNHKKNTWNISLFKGQQYIKEVDHGKEDVMDLRAFKTWLKSHKIKDGYMEFLRTNRWYCEKYPLANGVEFV